MHILVVEDEQKIANFISRGLKEEGYAVSNAYDGEQALEIALVDDFDVIVLDLMLPKIDGVKVCKTIRNEKIVTPIIMLTAKDNIEDKVAGLDSGANDYMTKPFAIEELLARIRVLLRKNNKEIIDKLQVKNVTLDLLAREVYKNKKKVDLTTKEIALLEYLMRNKNSVVTRTMILEHVWDINFDPSTNIIDVHINHLRHKLDEDPNTPFILTIRGRGYIIKEQQSL